MVGETLFFSVEKPWENNEPFNSCIPTGDYFLSPAKSSSYGDCLCISNGDDVTRFQTGNSKRYACLIHAANYPRDVLGCVGLGDNYLPEKNMVTRSKKSIEKFYELVDPTKSHKFTITEIDYENATTK